MARDLPAGGPDLPESAGPLVERAPAAAAAVEAKLRLLDRHDADSGQSIGSGDAERTGRTVGDEHGADRELSADIRERTPMEAKLDALERRPLGRDHTTSIPERNAADASAVAPTPMDRKLALLDQAAERRALNPGGDQAAGRRTSDADEKPVLPGQPASPSDGGGGYTPLEEKLARLERRISEHPADAAGTGDIPDRRHASSQYLLAQEAAYPAGSESRLSASEQEPSDAPNPIPRAEESDHAEVGKVGGQWYAEPAEKEVESGSETATVNRVLSGDLSIHDDEEHASEAVVEQHEVATGARHPPPESGGGWTPPDALRPLERLEPRLAAVYLESMRTDGGRAFYGEKDHRMRDAASAVRPLAGVYTADLHGTPGSFIVDGTTLDGRDLGRLIRADGEWRGRPIRLVSCETGRGEAPVAQDLADHLGVPVVAPTELVANKEDGSLILIKERRNSFGRIKQSVAQDGQWIRFLPR
ncbi:hypothetical protein [Frankia sp. ACN1ag]|uniref:hypothetical protein n=1 Tax=Frankia sp. ACN1ag TaxID=102891 RepID=UPI000B0EE405|nr:hypothetical protein [Frankia sp. ACN1ag]